MRDLDLIYPWDGTMAGTDGDECDGPLLKITFP